MEKNIKKTLTDIVEDKIQKSVASTSQEIEVLINEIAIAKSDGNMALIDFKTKELKQNADEKVAQLKTIIDGRIKQLEGKIPKEFDPKEIKSELVSANKKIAKNLADIKKIITKTVLPIEEGIVKLNLKSGTLNEKFDNLKVPLKHKDLEDIWPDDHHPELHLLESHPGVQATSAELNRLVDGSDAGPLHTHAELRNIIISGGGMGEARVIDLINTYGGAGGGINNVVEDLTPQLGGNLDGQAFTITTTNTISGGIVRTNNYQNLGGTESFIWSAGDDWWELSDDFHMVGVITGVASYNGLVITANTGVITTGTWNGTDIAVADGGTGLGAIADGSVLATNAANVLSAITWHAAGTKILTNIDGTISWEAAGAGAPTAWDDIGDPDADGTVAFAGFEQTLTSTLNEAAHTTLTIYNSTADLTAAVTLLKLTYKDDGDADGTFLNCLDNNSGDSKFSIAQDGNTLIAGTLGVTGVISGALTGTVGAAGPTTVVGTTITANTGFCADVNDGSYLGVSGTAFSDLFLASGAVIDFLAGAVTITHSANTLTIAGSAYTTLALGATNITCTGTIDNLTAAHVTTLSVDHIGEHTGSHTIVADNTITAATGASIILPAGGAIKLTLPTTDAQCTGHYTDSFQSGYTAAAGDLVYYGTGGKWLEVDADAVATCKGLLGIAMEAKNDTEAMKVALPGSMVHFDAWTWTTGDTLYAGETLGAIQNAIPTGADAVIKVVGVAIDADTIYFMGSPDQQTTVA